MKKNLAELITIFLGVALAFLAEDYREYRRDRAEESEVISSLASEFAENSERLATVLGLQERATLHLAALDEYLADAPTDVWLEVPDTLLTWFFSAATYDPARGSVDALLSSGRIGIIRDEQLRTAVAGWPGYLADAVEDQLGQRDFVLRTALPYLLQLGVPVRDLFVSLGASVAGRPPDAMRMGVTRVQATEELRGLIGVRLFIAQMASQDLTTLAEHESRVRELLRANGARVP